MQDEQRHQTEGSPHAPHGNAAGEPETGLGSEHQIVPELLQSHQELQQDEARGYEYHRLFRGMRNYRWWKPLVFGLIALVIGFTLTQVVMMLFIMPIMMRDGFEGLLAFQERILQLDTQDPLAIATAFASIAVWIPAIMFAGWAVGLKPVGRIWSVAFRIRWRFLFATVGLSIVIIVGVQLVASVLETFLMPPADAALPEAIPGFRWDLAITTLVLALVLVPFQAAAEELMFRGASMQVLGAWFKSPIIPIIVPSVLFAFGHIYDPLGLVQVGMMGLVCAWLTWRTGGLEAAISLHVINNLFVFVLLSTGITGQTSQGSDTGGSWWSLLIVSIMYFAYAAIAVRMFDRKYRSEGMSVQPSLSSQAQTGDAA